MVKIVRGGGRLDIKMERSKWHQTCQRWPQEPGLVCSSFKLFWRSVSALRHFEQSAFPISLLSVSDFPFLKLWVPQGWRPPPETHPTVFSLEHKTKESSNNGKSRKHRNTMVRNVCPQWIGFDRTEKDNNNCVAPSNTIDLTTFCCETISFVTLIVKCLALEKIFSTNV